MAGRRTGNRPNAPPTSCAHRHKQARFKSHADVTFQTHFIFSEKKMTQEKNSRFGVAPYEGPVYQAARIQPDDAVLGLDVHVTARGANRSTGFHVFLRIDPAQIAPPELDFVNLPPTGIVAPVIVPFSVGTTLKYPLNVEFVTIHDTRGSHRVPIERILAANAA
jgi:hypothetical protein